MLRRRSDAAALFSERPFARNFEAVLRILLLNLPGLLEHWFDLVVRDDNCSGRVRIDVLTEDHGDTTWHHRYVA